MTTYPFIEDVISPNPYSFFFNRVYTDLHTHAISLNAMRDTHGAQRFYMVADDGAIVCNTFSDGRIVLNFHFVKQPTLKIGLKLEKPGFITYMTSEMASCTPERMTRLMRMFASAWIAPYVRTPHGLTFGDNQKLVGIVFLTGENYSPTSAPSWENLGYRLQACVINHDVATRFPFINEVKPTKWLEGYYAARHGGEVTPTDLKQYLYDNQPTYMGGDGRNISWLVLSRQYRDAGGLWSYRNWNPTLRGNQRLDPPAPPHYTEWPYNPEKYKRLNGGDDKKDRFEYWLSA